MIRQLANSASFGEFVGFVVALVAGLGCLGYVAGIWVLHLVAEGRYITTAFLCLCVSAIAIAALARIPVALILFLGTAMVLGTGFAVGAGALFLP